MKAINKTTIILSIATLLAGFGIGWLLSGNKSSEKHIHETMGEAATQEWTCSMHPSVRQTEPGKCPICGMDLIPVDTDNSKDEPLDIRMSPAAIQLANIQTSSIKAVKPKKEVRLNGKIQADERKVYSQTAHIPGRVEDLLVNVTGEYVRKGQIIANLYSPELVTAQKELLEAYKIRQSQPGLYAASRQKLKNWKFTDGMIDQIVESQQLNERFPIHSDINGVVTEKKINLGDHVDRGSILYEIADLSRLWILFDIYESDIPWIKVGDQVEFMAQSLPGETFSGKIDFIDPVIHPVKRVATARVTVQNRDMRMKPEMFVSGLITSSLSDETPRIVIPRSAIMWTGKRSIVYVKTNTGTGISFRLREVTLGPSLGESYIVEDGLNHGEEIATYGTFSIDAAAQLAGMPSMMAPEGGMAQTGHQHDMDPSHHAPETGIDLENISLSVNAKETLVPLVEVYLTMKDALVHDDYERARSAASDLARQFEKVPMSVFDGNSNALWMNFKTSIDEPIRAIVEARNIEDLRGSFKPLSEAMIQLVSVANPINKKLYIQHCPMADDFNGANWLSTEENIMNPYFGASMLTCGNVEDEIAGRKAVEPKAEPIEIKSPPMSAMSNIGDNHIHIEYNSPRVRGRVIFGGLVAYDQVWSTGAHNVTSIRFEKDVRINNTHIKAGKYALFTIPGSTQWTVILNTNWEQHLADEYDQNEDVLRFSVTPRVNEEIKEALTFEIYTMGNNSVAVKFQWEKISFEFEVLNH